MGVIISFVHYEIWKNLTNKERTDDMLGVKIFHRKKRNACRCSEPMPKYFYNLPGFYVCIFWEVFKKNIVGGSTANLGSEI